MVSPSAPQSPLVHPRTVAISVASSPGSQSTLIGSCQQTDGLKSMGDSPESMAAKCNAHPAPPPKPVRLRKMQAPSTTRVLLRVASPKTPPSTAVAWYSKRAGSNVDASAPISRASSSPSRSAPIEQHPWPSSAAGYGRIPRQPRPQMQVQFEVRNERSNRHVVSPSEISAIGGFMGAQRKGGNNRSVDNIQ